MCSSKKCFMTRPILNNQTLTLVRRTNFDVKSTLVTDRVGCQATFPTAQPASARDLMRATLNSENYRCFFRTWKLVTLPLQSHEVPTPTVMPSPNVVYPVTEPTRLVNFRTLKTDLIVAPTVLPGTGDLGDYLRMKWRRDTYTVTDEEGGLPFAWRVEAGL